MFNKLVEWVENNSKLITSIGAILFWVLLIVCSVFTFIEVFTYGF